MKQKLIYNLFALALVFSVATMGLPAVQAETLADIDGHKNETAIQWVYDHKIVSGYSDGNYMPDQSINRGEWMKILVEANELKVDATRYKNCFPDVREEWFAPYVCYGKEQGWVSGYPDGMFRADQGVKKEEAIKMLVNSRGYQVSNALTAAPALFSDVKSNAWFYPYVKIAKEKQILEQTNGTYGVGTLVTRGEVTENIYRALMTEQNSVSQFTDYLTWLKEMGEDFQTACDSPVRGMGALVAENGEMSSRSISVCEGYRYTACTQDMIGNADLYGGSEIPTLNQYGASSTDEMMTVKDAEGKETEVVRPDCITFAPENTGYYYLGIYGAGESVNSNIWVSASKIEDVPTGFENSLTWFTDGCTELTNDKYGPFNTPWGNDEDLERPFYDGYPNYLHGGVDFTCPADTEVKAMCDGVIADSDDAGGGWGWHTVVDCKKADKTISIVTIHLQEDSVLPIGTEVKAGDVIGKVFPMDIPGEKVHIHLTGCRYSHDECEADGFHPERGASRRTEWWGAAKLWFDMDWHTNPGLYKELPE